MERGPARRRYAIGVLCLSALIVACSPSAGPRLIVGRTADNLPHLTSGGFAKNDEGRSVWGCHLIVRIPLAQVTDSTYSFDYSVRYGGQWHTYARISLAHERGSPAQSATYVTPQVYSPNDHITSVRYRIFHGQMKQRTGVDTVPLVCPPQPSS